MRPLRVWWLNPVLLFSVINGGLAILATVTSPGTYVERWSTPKYFDGPAMILTVLCIAAFALGASLPGGHFRGWAGPREKPSVSGLPVNTMLWLYRIAVALALLGYVVWGSVAVSHGMNLQVVMDALKGRAGAAYLIREHYLLTVVGVTTCTQFGVAAAVLGSLIAAQCGWRKIGKSLALLFALAFVRALLNTERLAILELVIAMAPAIASMALGPRAARSRRLRLAILSAPVAGICGVFFLFAGFEYGRSWTTYYAGGSDFFWAFALYRLTGYYVTALNNTAFLLTRLITPERIPFFTMSFLWRFPFISGLVNAMFPNFELVNSYFDTLNTGANAEFNNGGGLLAPAIDFGPCGAILYWLLAGMLSGWIYRSFKRGTAWGLCLYPLLFLGLLEVPRGLYLTGGRATPPICFLILSAYLLAIGQRRAQTAEAGNESQRFHREQRLVSVFR